MDKLVFNPAATIRDLQHVGASASACSGALRRMNPSQPRFFGLSAAGSADRAADGARAEGANEAAGREPPQPHSPSHSPAPPT